MSGPAPTILVIEDEPGVRESLAGYLEDCGYRVQQAGDGQAGMELMVRQPPDVVLTDLRMPVMGGLELLAAMAADYSDIPVIIVSGRGEFSDAIHAVQLGAWDYLTKPIRDMAVLEHSVKRALEHARLVRQNREYQDRLEHTVARLRQTLDALREDEEVGRRIQFQLLPPAHQQLGPVLFQRMLMPSTSLSGDFVDYFRIDARHLGFYLADVAGHGVSSALITVILHSSMSHYLLDCWQGKSDLVLDPPRVLDDLNRTMLGHHLEKHLTMFYGVIDLASDVLRFTNAAQHPAPILFDGKETRAIGNPNMPVGLFSYAQYQVEQIALPVRFLLLLCSDGALELLPGSGIKQKEVRLHDMVGKLTLGIDELLSRFGIPDTEGVRDLPDDVTLMVVTR